MANSKIKDFTQQRGEAAKIQKRKVKFEKLKIFKIFYFQDYPGLFHRFPGLTRTFTAFSISRTFPGFRGLQDFVRTQ